MLNDACIENLRSLKSVIQPLDDSQFAQALDVLSDASVGQHVRHVIEFYSCLLNQAERGEVNYDSRQRDPMLQNRVHAALNMVDHLIHRIDGLRSEQPLMLLGDHGTHEPQPFKVPSNLQRELAFNLEHAIHHQALIKIGLRQLGASTASSSFGVAPSTLRNLSNLTTMKTSLTSLLFILTTGLFAQGTLPSSTMSTAETAMDVAVAFGSNVSSQALGIHRTHGMGDSKRFRMGYGLRLSAFRGENLDYITAPFALSSDPATVDTLTLNAPFTAGLSVGIHLGYFVTPKLMLGFNIDALGVGFGSTDEGDFVSSDNDGSFPTTIEAMPTSSNVLLVGDNDIGQLKSEFVVAYNLNDTWRLRAGGDFTFSEYTTTEVLTNDNDRFRHKAFMAFVGASYVIGQTEAE